MDLAAQLAAQGCAPDATSYNLAFSPSATLACPAAGSAASSASVVISLKSTGANCTNTAVTINGEPPQGPAAQPAVCF